MKKSNKLLKQVENNIRSKASKVQDAKMAYKRALIEKFKNKKHERITK